MKNKVVEANCLEEKDAATNYSKSPTVLTSWTFISVFGV